MTTERRWRVGFRGRVLGSFVALVAFATLAGLFVQRAVLLRQLDDEVDTTLEQERSELESLAGGIDPATGQPFAGDVRAIFDTFLERNLPLEGEAFFTFVDGRPYASTPAPIRLDLDPALASTWANLTTGTRSQLSSDAGPVRYLAVPLVSDGRTNGVFVVANFVQGEQDEIDHGIRVAAAVALGVLLVATGIAWVVAGRLLRPVRELTETAERISDTDLSQRIPVTGSDELGRLAQQFNEMLDRLESAFAHQRTFVDDAGHELRTPITIVRGHLEVMGDDPDDRRETIALVTDELDRMARIVDDLLLMAKADQPDFVRLDTVEVADLTADLLAKARTLADREWTLDGAAVGEIRVDRQRVTQAVLNLARNAVEHTASGPIAIGSAWHADGLHLWVRDHGPGVDPADRERIFDRFARGAGPRRSDGAGLGLAIVRSVAEAHGGHVELESRRGDGATFTIVLPGRPPPPEPVDPPTSPEHELATPDQQDPTEPIPVVGSDEPTREIRPSREPTT